MENHEAHKRNVLEAVHVALASLRSFSTNFMSIPDQRIPFNSMELNPWEYQDINRVSLQAQIVARNVRRNLDALVDDAGNRGALTLKLYSLMLNLDGIRSVSGRACAERIWETMFNLLVALLF
uniref:Uncharacterized protein n=1 Tax=Oryza punctata TaxID=4537 RepID=A0A0E0MHJ0_ORYPU